MAHEQDINMEMDIDTTSQPTSSDDDSDSISNFSLVDVNKDEFTEWDLEDIELWMEDCVKAIEHYIKKFNSYLPIETPIPNEKQAETLWSGDLFLQRYKNKFSIHLKFLLSQRYFSKEDKIIKSIHKYYLFMTLLKGQWYKITKECKILWFKYFSSFIYRYISSIERYLLLLESFNTIILQNERLAERQKRELNTISTLLENSKNRYKEVEQIIRFCEFCTEDGDPTSNKKSLEDLRAELWRAQEKLKAVDGLRMDELSETLGGVTMK